MVSPLHEVWRYSHGDPGIVLFTRALEQWKFDIPDGARVLELGCCESDWAQWLMRARPNVQLTGIDVRSCPDFPGEFIQGDAAAQDWGADRFDWVVGIGSIEHFGLGWSEYGDPVNAYGDMRAVDRAVRSLTLGGHVYFDVPYTPYYFTQTKHYRVYSDNDIFFRLCGPIGGGKDHCENWRVVERARGFAPNERESEFSPVRPLVPMSPFYFTSRWLTKVA